MRAKKILIYSTDPIILLKTHTLPLSLSLLITPSFSSHLISQNSLKQTLSTLCFGHWVVVVLWCALVSGLRSVCGFDVWVARFGFDGFRHLGCWISGVTVEMVVVVGHIGVGSICDLWLWACFVVCYGFILWWLCRIFIYLFCL